MKDKLIMFIAGLLVGAIIATGAIYFYTLSNSSNNNLSFPIDGVTPPDMPDGQVPRDVQRPDMQNDQQQGMQNENNRQKRNQANNI